MALATRDDLRAALLDWTVGSIENPDVVHSFIALAEAEFNRRLRTREMLGRSVALVSEPYTPLPGDFLQAKNCTATRQGGGSVALLQTTMEKADLHRREREGGLPAYFVVSGAEMEIVPHATGAAVEVELVYYRRIPALAADNPANWLLLKWPDLYLNAALAHAQPYLANPQLGAFHRAEADRIAEEVRFQDHNAQLGAAPLIARPARFFP